MAGARIDFDDALNPQQLQAVTHGEGPQLVLAGAGSGKTRVITYRIAWLVQERGVDPAQITAVTFTNKAAGEMKERVEELLAIRPLPAFVGTFHRFALRLLRIYGQRVDLERGFLIFDASDQLNLVKKALKAEGLDEKSFRPRSVLSAISGAKNRLLGPSKYERQADDFFGRKVAPVYRRYQALLGAARAVDFDDMIALAVRLLAEHPDLRHRIRRRARYLLVDEFQDTNHAQLALVHQLAGTDGNLTAVGDEDQGIYRWRGAELSNILEFEKSFPGAEIRKLERNYRSTQNILDAAGEMVARNENRRGKTLWTEAGDGDKVVLYRARDERDEARWVANLLQSLEGEVPLAETAVLVRTNAQTRSFEEQFLRRGMPYLLVGAIRFYERAEIKDLVAYLRFLRNPRDDVSLGRILNRPPRGIGKTTQAQLEARAAELDRSLWGVLADDDLEGIPGRGAAALRRFHKAFAPLVDETPELPLPVLLERLLEVSAYAELYDPDDEEGRGKLENIDELISAVGEFAAAHGYAVSSAAAGAEAGEEDLLTAFLDHVSLVSDTDSLGSRRGVSVMTLHSAKGLEFRAVVVAGLEEKLLPHLNAVLHPESLEEERRLLYVGMTRARERLFLTTCRRRMIAGSYQDQEESRFLAEIPARYLEVEQSPELFQRSRPSYRGSGRPGSGLPGSGLPGSNRQPASDQAQNVYSFFGRGRPPAAAPSPVAAAPFDETAEFDEAPRRRGGLRRGAWVRHAKLGRGRVLSIEGSGDDARLVVYFQGQGRRKLVAKYANLEVF